MIIVVTFLGSLTLRNVRLCMFLRTDGPRNWSYLDLLERIHIVYMHCC